MIGTTSSPSRKRPRSRYSPAATTNAAADSVQDLSPFASQAADESALAHRFPSTVTECHALLQQAEAQKLALKHQCDGLRLNLQSHIEKALHEFEDKKQAEYDAIHKADLAWIRYHGTEAQKDALDAVIAKHRKEITVPNERDSLKVALEMAEQRENLRDELAADEAFELRNRDRLREFQEASIQFKKERDHEQWYKTKHKRGEAALQEDVDQMRKTINGLRVENAALKEQLRSRPHPPRQQQHQFGPTSNNTTAQTQFTFGMPIRSNVPTMQNLSGHATMNYYQDMSIRTSRPLKTVCSKCHDIDCKTGSECGAETMVD